MADSLYEVDKEVYSMYWVALVARKNNMARGGNERANRPYPVDPRKLYRYAEQNKLAEEFNNGKA